MPLVRLDVALLVHTSSSVQTPSQLRAFLKDFVRNLNVLPTATRVGMIVFNSNARIEFDFNRYPDVRSIEAAIDRIQFSNFGNNLASGLELLESLYIPSRGDRADAPNLVYLFLGATPDNVPRSFEIANRLKMRGMLIGVVAVGFSSGIRTSILSNIAYDRPFFRQSSNIDALGIPGIRRIGNQLASGELLPKGEKLCL